MKFRHFGFHFRFSNGKLFIWNSVIFCSFFFSILLLLQRISPYMFPILKIYNSVCIPGFLHSIHVLQCWFCVKQCTRCTNEATVVKTEWNEHTHEQKKKEKLKWITVVTTTTENSLEIFVRVGYAFIRPIFRCGTLAVIRFVSGCQKIFKWGKIIGNMHTTAIFSAMWICHQNSTEILLQYAIEHILHFCTFDSNERTSKRNDLKNGIYLSFYKNSWNIATIFDHFVKIICFGIEKFVIKLFDMIVIHQQFVVWIEIGFYYKFFIYVQCALCAVCCGHLSEYRTLNSICIGWHFKNYWSHISEKFNRIYLRVFHSIVKISNDTVFVVRPVSCQIHFS